MLTRSYTAYTRLPATVLPVNKALRRQVARFFAPLERQHGKDCKATVQKKKKKQSCTHNAVNRTTLARHIHLGYRGIIRNTWLQKHKLSMLDGARSVDDFLIIRAGTVILMRYIMELQGERALQELTGLAPLLPRSAH